MKIRKTLSLVTIFILIFSLFSGYVFAADGTNTAPTFDITITADKASTWYDSPEGFGDDVKLTISVTNTGNVDIGGIQIVDSALGLSKTISLKVGDTFIKKLTASIPGLGTYENTVVASCNGVSKEASCSVNAKEAYGVEVAVTADNYNPKVGDAVNYTIKVKNTCFIPFTAS